MDFICHLAYPFQYFMNFVNTETGNVIDHNVRANVINHAMKLNRPQNRAKV
jgi:hypothetical protein